ncbi:hypothetical protein Lal_00016422 [Lupinus albus]|uniref:DUF7890 domain-containing protein n=1 Tax=Lupinus albus TaxID=3870 RepID=A0A6A5MEV7_LUPAL|nr:hypothetical protein Lalb_Chr05g0224131 [Lupinus albus]KAF1872586.1 hypothetical protein Lal_00016422 [Lupinus albus]
MIISTMFSYLNRKISHKKVKLEPLKVTKAIYRDELTTKKQTPKKRVKKCVRFSDSEPTILGEDSEKEIEKRNSASNEIREREGIRVKIKLTKEEAVRFLTKFNEGVLEFKDVAHELVSIPVNRVSFGSTIKITNNL